MTGVAVIIDDNDVSGREDMTILELARENGIEIPTLCHLPGLPPTGACRICVVEVKGSKTLVGSCHTPITQGMVIYTNSPKVLKTRKVILELLLASHCGTCYMCEKANLCELRKVAADLDVGLSRFHIRKRYYPIEDLSPYIQRDLSKCILCRKCVKACREIAKQSIFGIAYRGFDSKIVVDADQPLNKDVCRDCLVCIPVCPTGALSHPRKIGDEKKGTPLVIASSLPSSRQPAGDR
jgi:NADH dehydrogenase/NADH:ubiquinone oxidoreductase subunit G